MTGKRGSRNTLPWVKRKMRSIAFLIYQNQGSTGKVSWQEIRDMLRTYMEKTQVDPKDADSPYLIDEYHLPVSPGPYESAINVLHNDELSKLSHKKIDAPWSLGVHSANGLPDGATRACVEVWRWTELNPRILYARHAVFLAPFSIRQARWVSMLRWVEKAGGSDSGAVTDVEKLWIAAYRYAVQERHIEAVDDGMWPYPTTWRGMHSPILDLQLMFSEVKLFDLKLFDELTAHDDSQGLISEIESLFSILSLWLEQKG